MFDSIQRIVTWPVRYLFGRDVFISYARTDDDANANAYVLNLAARLRALKPRVRYFLDLHAATADPVLPVGILRHARRCRVFVLVGSEAALRTGSGAMQELAEFANRGRRLFVPIDVDGAYAARDRNATPWSRLSGSPPEHATAEEVTKGIISNLIVDRIAELAGNSRLDQRLWRASMFALLLVAGGVLFFVRSIVAEGDARANRLAAAATSSTMHDYSLALLLASEALAIRPNFPFPRSALLDLLTSHGGLMTILHPTAPSSDDPLSRDVNALAASPDGATIASGQATGIVRLWNAQTLTESYDAMPVGGIVLTIAFDRTGTRLLIATSNGRVLVRDLRSRRDRMYSMQTGAVAAFRPDGGLAVLSGELIVDPATNETLLHAAPKTLSMAFSPDGATVVTGGADGTLHAYDWKTRQPLGIILPQMAGDECSKPQGEGAHIWSIVSSPTDATLFAAADREGNIVSFHCGAGNTAHALLSKAEPRLAFDSTGRYLAATGNKELKIYTMPELSQTGTFTYADQPVSIAFAKDREAVMTGNRDGTITLFSLDGLDTFGRARALETRVSGPIGSMREAAFTMAADRVGMTDQHHRSLVVALPGARAAAGSITLPLVSRRGFVDLRDVATGRLIRSFPLPPQTFATDVAVSGDGRRIAALVRSDKQQAVMICDTANGELLKQLPLSTHLAMRIALDLHGDRIAFGDIPGNVIVESTAWGIVEARFFQDERISAIAFSPDGHTLVASDLGGTAIYDLDARVVLGRREVKADCLAFAPDGRTMAVCETDALRIWPMTSEAWCATARRIAGRPLSADERMQYVGGR